MLCPMLVKLLAIQEIPADLPARQQIAVQTEALNTKLSGSRNRTEPDRTNKTNTGTILQRFLT